EEDDRQGRSELAQPILQFGAAQTGNPDIEKNASKLAFVGQVIEQLLGGRIGRDGIPRLLQTPFDGDPERCIIINHVDGTRQRSLLVQHQRHRQSENRTAVSLILSPESPPCEPEQSCARWKALFPYPAASS